MEDTQTHVYIGSKPEIIESLRNFVQVFFGDV
jgi:hypothetical protein